MDISRTTTGPVAVRFFLVGLAAMASSLALGIACAWLWPPDANERLVFPAAFFATTLLLIGVSVSLHRAVQAVRRERQRRFRRRLLAALIAGTLFVGLQGYGLLCLISGGRPGEAQLGARPFLFVFASMHCLHVSVALLFLAYVAVRGFNGRYDHEYYWGPFITGWFWHALGVVWLVLLGVLGLAL